jgi:hypothetical protein
MLVNKAPEMVAAVQNREQFHGAEAGGGETSKINRTIPRSSSGLERYCRDLDGWPSS